MRVGVVPHNCEGRACDICDHNESVGGRRNHPTAPRRPAAKPAARTPLPVRGRCEFLGKRTEKRAGCNGRLCRHECDAGEPFAVPGGVCQTCEKWVAEYDPSARPDAPDLPRWHPVQPPAIGPLVGRLANRLVITVVVGDDAELMHAATGPGQKAYADRLGADYVVLRGRTQDARMPCAEKWRVKDYVPHYPGGTLYLDADVWIHPQAPDVIAATPADAIGMVDIAPYQPSIRTWFPLQLRATCESQGVPVPPAEAKYWNSGVWVGRPQHAAYWEPPAAPYPTHWCTEELWCRVNAHRHGLRVFDLDPRYNWTWNNDKDLSRATAAPPWLFHFAGMAGDGATRLDGRAWRLALLRLLAASAGGPQGPQPPAEQAAGGGQG